MGCDASGKPGSVERVLAIKTAPLSLEFYERSTSSGMRLDWKAPYGKAQETFSNMVKLAKKVESGTSDTVGYGLASKPVTGMSEDSLWKAMLYAMRNPAECGLKVDGVTTRDMAGFMQRTMRILEKPGGPTVTDNIRVLESAQEITYRPVINGVEAEEERVFALRKDPLRFEMFCRNSKDDAPGLADPQIRLPSRLRLHHCSSPAHVTCARHLQGGELLTSACRFATLFT